MKNTYTTQNRIMKPTGLVQIYTYAMDGRNATFAIYHIQLDEEIDYSMMEESLQCCSKRFSYMNKKKVIEDNSICFVPNDAQVKLHKDSLDHIIDEQDNDGFLYRVGVCGSTLIVSFFHCLTDGKGMMNYIRFLLKGYYRRKHPEEMADCQDDILELQKEADPEEYMDPMSLVPDNIEAGDTKKGEFFLCPEQMDKKKKDNGVYWAYSFSCDGDKLLRFARESDGTPNAIMAVAFAKAMRNLYPQSIEKGIDIGITIDAKPIIGAGRSTLPCLQSSVFHFDEKILNMDDEMMHTCVRGKLITDSDRDRLLVQLSRIGLVDKLFGYMRSLKARQLLAFQSTDKPMSSGNISYAGAFDFGSIAYHIQGIYTYAEAATPLLEINYVNGRFYLALSASFDAKELAEHICKECRLMGIDCTEPEQLVLKAGLGKSNKTKLGINMATIQMIAAVNKVKKGREKEKGHF